MSSDSSLTTDHEDESADPTVGLISSNMEARLEHQKVKNYNVLYGITAVLGASLVILVLVWIVHFRGGFAWSQNPTLEFNWHPFLMILGLVFIYSQSMLAYRSGRKRPKKILKLIHAGAHFMAFIFSVIGLKAVFDSHNLAENPIPNLYTLHSWLGLITVILFTGQFLFGFVSFLYPGLSMSMRAATLPVHTYVGSAIFVFAIVSAMMGLTEKAIWTLGKNYQELPSEAMLINFMGLILACFGALSLYLVNDPNYKRANEPEENLNLTGHDE